MFSFFAQVLDLVILHLKAVNPFAELQDLFVLFSSNAWRSWALSLAKQANANAWPNNFKESQRRRSSPWTDNLVLSLGGRNEACPWARSSKPASHKNFLCELSSSHSWMVMTSWCGARPSELDCSMAEQFLSFSLKNKARVVVLVLNRWGWRNLNRGLPFLW